MWHTKITRINWENKFLFVIEDARVTFLSSSHLGHSHPPIWDSFHKVYFSGSSLSYLPGTKGQVAVHGVALWSIFAYCDRVLGINNQSMKAKLMLHIKHYAVHGPSTWFISSLPPLKWTFIAESSLCWRLKLWAVINEGHGFREASLLISCDTGTRWRPWSAASGKKSSRPRQVRGTQDHLPRVALKYPWLSSELLSLCLCEKKLFHPQNINILGWYRCWTAVWWEEPCALLFSYGIWQIFADVDRRLTQAAW